MYFFKVPGCDRGDLSKQCNPGGYLDYQVLGAYMIHPTDPEGLFTTLTATVTSLLGFEFGLLYQNERGRILLSFILLTFAYWFQFVNPLNKKLWSVSFTFLCAGFSGCVLSFCALITDRLFQYLAPLKWLGTNPLVVFVGMVFYEVVLLDNIKMDDGRSAWDAWYQDWFASWIGAGQLASFLFSFVHVVFWVLVTGVMHYKKIFVKL
jgi:predicted acyltransferase